MNFPVRGELMGNVEFVDDGRDTPLMINSTSLDLVPAFVFAEGAIVESGR
jgi:hypothetical protein